VTIERFEQHGVRPGKLVGLAQISRRYQGHYAPQARPIAA
jgi:hypothetical protein